METKQAEQEISLIRKIMEDSKQAAVDNGKYYIFWGVLVSAALILNYIMILMKVDSGEYYGLLWFTLMSTGAVVSSVMKMRDMKKAKVQTFTAKIINSLWMACGIAMFIIGFAGPAFGVYGYFHINALISIILGIAYYVNGEVQQIKWFKFLTLGWWIGGILLFAYPGRHSLLVSGLMLLFFQNHFPG